MRHVSPRKNPTRKPSENWFESADGVNLFYRHWPAPTDGGERAIILFHRGHEQSGRLQHLVDQLGFEDFAVFAWDARGYAESFGQLEKDVDCFVKHVCLYYRIPAEILTILAQSVGSVIVAAGVRD